MREDKSDVAFGVIGVEPGLSDSVLSVVDGP